MSDLDLELCCFEIMDQILELLDCSRCVDFVELIVDHPIDTKIVKLCVLKLMIVEEKKSHDMRKWGGRSGVWTVERRRKRFEVL
jgi:hypothetical protein